jgi:hypothetical protein
VIITKLHKYSIVDCFRNTKIENLSEHIDRDCCLIVERMLNR